MQSFRFGPEIAYVSALLLRTLKEVKRKTLVGNTDQGKNNIIHCLNILTKSCCHCTRCCILYTGCVYGTEDFRQVTIIARTNLGLFEEMAKVIKSPGGERKRLGFVGVSDIFYCYNVGTVWGGRER